MKKKKDQQISVPEITVHFERETEKFFPSQIKSSASAADLLRNLWKKGQVELQEVMMVVYLDRANQPIGWYRHSVGGVSGTILDIPIVLGTAVKALAQAMIISHNHPSGNTQPSQADIKVTNQIRKAAEHFNITVLDHIIITKDSYTSFADEGLSGVVPNYPIISRSAKVIEEDRREFSKEEIEAKALQLELELLEFKI